MEHQRSFGSTILEVSQPLPGKPGFSLCREEFQCITIYWSAGDNIYVLGQVLVSGHGQSSVAKVPGSFKISWRMGKLWYFGMTESVFSENLENGLSCPIFVLAVAEECEIWSWLPLQSATASEKTSSNPRVNHCLACVYNKTQTDCWSFLKERSRWSSAEHMQYCKLSVIKLLDNEERFFALQTSNSQSF